MAGLVLLAAAVAVRLIRLEYYPPANADEGLWFLGPRNFVLYGDGLMDGLLHPFLAPAQFVVASIWFYVFEPTYHYARAFAAFCGIATVTIAWVLARRIDSRHTLYWLGAFGLQSQMVLATRLALMESIQLPLLLASIYFLLGRRSNVLAGAALAVCALVKVNALYAVAAFGIYYLVAFRSDRAALLHSLRDFGAGFAVVFGGGMLTDYLISPRDFALAFRFELNGAHFRAPEVLFAVGRFGLNTQRLSQALIVLVTTSPFLVAFTAAAMLKRDNWKTPENSLVFSWVLIGLVFLNAQIMVLPRYYMTFYPAMTISALIGARPYLARPGIRSGLIVAFLGFHLARLAVGLQNPTGSHYVHLEQALRSQTCPADRLLAAHYVSLAAPPYVKSFGMYRLLFDYPDDRRIGTLSDVIREKDITLLVSDSEVRAYVPEHEIRDAVAGGNVLLTDGEFTLTRIRPCPSHP